MKKAFLIFSILGLVAAVSAQESGNRIYGNQGYYNQQKRQPPTNTGALSAGSFNFYATEASVLINVKADAFVAVFGINEEAPTAAASNDKVNRKVAALSEAAKSLGVTKDDIFVDFITQNRVYDYIDQGSSVIEKFSGFETKKTVAIRYKNRDIFEKLVSAAAEAQVYDLIKVDYIVADFESVRARLFDEAVKVIKAKEAKYTSLLGAKLTPIGLANEKYDAFYPSDSYQRYQAYESGQAETNYERSKIIKRKSFTFYYEPLDASKFDKVINPVGIEPLVQFTLYLRMEYDAGRIKPETEKPAVPK